MKFACVVAADEAGGIGVSGQLPWHLPPDLEHFKRTTSTASAGRRNAVIMGRVTWDSIPLKFRPLAGRINIVVSRKAHPPCDGVFFNTSLEDALVTASLAPDIDRAFVIGGTELYKEAFTNPACTEIVLTRIFAQYPCDRFLPAMNGFVRSDISTVDTFKGLRFQIEYWRKLVGPRVSVFLTPNLARYVRLREVTVPPGNAREVLENVGAHEPRLLPFLVDEHGELREHVNMFVNGTQIQDRRRLTDAVSAGADVYFMQALSDG